LATDEAGMASMENSMQNILDESIEQANRLLESQELLNQAQDMVIENEQVDKATAPITKLTVLGGVLTNKTKGPLSVMDKHKYAGHILTSYPDPLKVTGTFAMSALSNKGVKAAVVYSGKNKHGVECGWLLAFADTKDTGRRVSTNHTQPSVPKIIGASYFQKTLLLRKEMCYEVKEKL